CLSDWSSDVCSSDLAIRRTALVHRVPYTTTMSAASAACDAIIALRSRAGSVRSLQEWHEKTALEKPPHPAENPAPGSRAPRAVRSEERRVGKEWRSR